MDAIWFKRSIFALMGATLAMMTLSSFMVSGSTGLALPAWVIVGQREHRLLAGFVSLLALSTLYFARRADGNGWVFRLSLGVVLMVVMQAGLGMSMASLGSLPWLAVVQATLMHFVLVSVVVMALLDSRFWKQKSEFVEDEFRPSLRSMAWLPVWLIVLQVVLGSAYRHGLVGVIPHLLGAMLVAGLLALVGLLVATAYPKHWTLRTSALAVVWLMLAQVVLGVVALSYRAGITGAITWNANFVLFTVAHVLLGSVTLAACVWLALSIRKHVADAEGAPDASIQGRRA